MDDDDEKSKEGDEKSRKHVLRSAVLMPVIGAGLGTGVGAIMKDKKHMKYGALNGAVLGASAGLGTITGAKIGHALKKELVKSNKKYKDSWKKQSDLLDVSEGKMSEEDFIDKWGKKKED